MKSENRFQEWASGFSGCDGGDIGSPESRSIWFCGIEWAGGHSPAELEDELLSKVDTPFFGHHDPAQILEGPFNIPTMKLITAMHGVQVEDYAKMAHQLRPFVKGSTGYFKMNLLPISFKDTGHQRWQSEFLGITGFSNKEEYLAWCRRVRFAQMRTWVSRYKPKTIVCFGKTWINEFKAAFVNGDSEFTKEPILDREISWVKTSDDVLVVVCPFPVNRYGLNSNELLQAFGGKIGALTAQD